MSDPKRPELDCGDNSCMFAINKGGMRTNGGCRCFENAGFHRSSIKSAMEILPEILALRAENAELKAALDDARNTRLAIKLVRAEAERDKLQAERDAAQSALGTAKSALERADKLMARVENHFAHGSDDDGTALWADVTDWRRDIAAMGEEG